MSGLHNLLVCPECRGPIILDEDATSGVSCKSCGSVFMYDKDALVLSAPIEKPDEQHDWDEEEIEDYHSRIGEWNSLRDWYVKFGLPYVLGEYKEQRVQGRVINWLDPSPGSKGLDIACGAGYLIFDILKKYEDRSVSMMGIDITHHNINQLMKRARKSSVVNAIGVVANAQSLPFKDGTFDFVTCIEAIEHFIDPSEAVTEMKRVLKPGGRVFLTSPSRLAYLIWKKPFAMLEGPVKRFLDRKREIKQEGKSYYDDPIWFSELTGIFLDAGFDLEKVEKSVVLPPSSLFGLIPLWATKGILGVAGFLERHMMGVFSPLANHVLLVARKKGGDQ